MGDSQYVGFAIGGTLALGVFGLLFRQYCFTALPSPLSTRERGASIQDLQELGSPDRANSDFQQLELQDNDDDSL